MEYRHVGFNHPKNEVGVFHDLIDKYEKYGTLYIGVDFDNTILPYGADDLYDYDSDNEEGIEMNGFCDVVELLRWCKLLGLKLCLWTLPDSIDNLCWKMAWCNEKGIHMDYINESPLLRENSKKYGKPHFNLLLDDVAGLESSFSILYNVCEYIENKKKGNEEGMVMG